MNIIILIVTASIIIRVIRRRRSRPRPKRTARNNRTSRIERDARQAIEDYTKRIAAEKRKTAELEKQSAQNRKRAFQVKQARDDISHYEQQKRGYLNLYTASEAVYRDPNKPIKARQAAYAKMIGYDGKVRSIEKKIEKAAFIIGTV